MTHLLLFFSYLVKKEEYSFQMSEDKLFFSFESVILFL
ncbi:hypothetical protein Cs308_0113 [Candidatus Chlamydia sanziniae]|uniref:Uncharacterized protein n=1 Tax=Candidatus Chlamydia sanziniae TaxID=1806891 RepID=A0A1A9HW62_9CHLA|nr:hypothetical protein Cs308_0113 [Candidatus Chlamydia sanziniae]